MTKAGRNRLRGIRRRLLPRYAGAKRRLKEIKGLIHLLEGDLEAERAAMEPLVQVLARHRELRPTLGLAAEAGKKAQTVLRESIGLHEENISLFQSKIERLRAEVRDIIEKTGGRTRKKK